MTAKLVRNTIVFALVWLLAAFFGVSQVGADGETRTITVCNSTYGGGEECHEEEVPVEVVPEEEIVHEVVEAGIVDNPVLLGGLFASGLIAILAGKKIERVRLV